MDIANKNTERSTVIVAVLALLIIGGSLVISTWQSMHRQRIAEEEHLFLTSRTILLSVEHYLKRSPIRESSDRLASRTVEFFETLENQGEIVFAGIFDPQGGGHLLTTPAHGEQAITLPVELLQELFKTGSWHGTLNVHGRVSYVYAKRLGTPRSMLVQPSQTSRHPIFLIVGIDMEQHLIANQNYRQTAFFQAGYILAAALLSWALGTSFLARREQLRRAAVLETFQAKLVDNLPDGLLTLNTQQDKIFIQAANPAALSILRHSKADILGKEIAVLPKELANYLATHHLVTNPTSWQCLAVQGSFLEVLVLPLENDEATSFMLILRDRTELHNLEKSLADAEKLALVGTLATGVAHEIRNPLSALRGFAQYFVKKLAGQLPEETYAKTMVQEADRLNRVITDLLFLGRPKAIDPVKVDLQEMVGELTNLLRFDLEQKNIVIQQHLACAFVQADHEALKQVLLNLILNSIDAVEDKRNKNIAENKTIVEQTKELLIRSDQDLQNTWIEVQDKGCGMTPEQVEKAFTPFFTAKGHGTGLGLALVHRTILEHGGNVNIVTAPDSGCTVRLTFPKLQGKEDETPPRN